MAALLMRTALSSMLWWVLTGGRSDTIGLGFVGVAAAVGVSLWLLPPAASRIRLGGIAMFAAFFVASSIRGGVQVAVLAFRGRNRLRPALIELPLRLPHGEPRVLAVGVIGLMPGTVGVQLRDDTLLVHVLDERLPIAAEIERLEARVAEIFGGLSR